MARRTTTLIAAALAAMAAQGAMAQTIEVNTNTGLTGKISYVFNSKAETATAGAFLLTLTGGGPQYPNPFSFYGYCVDIPHTISNGDSYAVNLLPIPTALGANGGRIAWLYNNKGLAVSSKNEAVALQIALWELAYDSAPDLSAGLFQYGKKAKIVSLANSYLSQSVGMSSTAMLFAATSHPGGRNQDMIGPPPAAVPEPGALALIGSGLLTTGALRLRRPRKAQAARS